MTKTLNVGKNTQEAIINALYSRLIKEDIKLSKQALDYIKDTIDISSIVKEAASQIRVPLDGSPGKEGLPGKDGKDGENGNPGRDGRHGIDGKPGKNYVLTDQDIEEIINTIISKIPEPQQYVLTEKEKASIVKAIAKITPEPLPHKLTEDELQKILEKITPVFKKILEKAIKDLTFKIERGRIRIPYIGGGGAISPENFSYEYVASTKLVSIPEYQQMAVFGTLTIDGTIELNGSIALRD